MSIIITCGRGRPARVSSSTTLSKLAESELFGSQTGRIISSSSFENTDDSKVASPARSQFKFPFSVLISPLWAIYLNGWASFQEGNVLVEKRECTTARADTKRLSRSEEHPSELQSLMRISYDVFTLKK